MPELSEELRWLSTPEAHSIWEELVVTDGDLLKAIPKSIKLSVHRRQMLLEQWRYVHFSKEKFPTPERWFWTKLLLEQASDHWCSFETAADFPKSSKVYDLCSGAGADSVALAQRCAEVVSIDQDPVACFLTALNGARNGVAITSQCCSAETLNMEDGTYLHLDPDRRGTGTRVSSLSELRPGWEVIAPMIARSRGVSIKVAPATTLGEMKDPPWSVRFLSRNRSVRQQRWLWGLDRWPQNSLVISAYLRNQWHHEVFPITPNSRGDSSRFLQTRDFICESVQDFLADYDPAIRAAQCSLSMAQRIGCRVLHREGGYFTSDEAKVHPMLRWFRVIDVLPLDRKKLIAYCRQSRAKDWELKSRGVEVDLQELRRSIPTYPEADQVRTILFTKIADRYKAIVAEPII